MATTSPRPDEPNPLTGREREALHRIEAELTQRYRKLDRRLARARPSVTDRVVAALAVFAIVAVLIPPSWLAVLVLVAVMTMPLLISHSRSAREPDRPATRDG